MCHEIFLICVFVLYFLQPGKANLTSTYQNNFESFRRTKIVDCNNTKTSRELVDCSCPTNDCVYCDYGEVFIQGKRGAYCVKPKHPVYYSVMKNLHILEKEEPESFLQLGIVDEWDNNNDCKSGKNCDLSNETKTINNLFKIKEVMVVLGTINKTKDENFQEQLIILTLNVTTQCEEEYIQFTYDIKKMSSGWKISKTILQTLSLFFVLLEFFIYVSIKELRNNTYGKCVIW